MGTAASTTLGVPDISRTPDCSAVRRRGSDSEVLVAAPKDFGLYLAASSLAQMSTSGRFYVATDSNGVEHSVAQGHVTWRLPAGDVAQATEVGRPLVLRRPDALLEVLDERIYEAEPLGDATISHDGGVSVRSARLLAQTPWDTEMATRFALDCADHLLGETGDTSLPDGTSLAKVVADARRVLDGIETTNMEHLGYLARLRALRRLRHEARFRHQRGPPLRLVAIAYSS